MALRGMLRRMLERGDAPEVDPDGKVELVTVNAFEGPMIVEVLDQAGIEATATDAFDLVTQSLTRTRIDVARSDLEAAQQVLVDFQG